MGNSAAALLQLQLATRDLFLSYSLLFDLCMCVSYLCMCVSYLKKNAINIISLTLCEKYPNTEFFLVRIFPYSD